MKQDQASPSAIVPDNDFAGLVERFEQAVWARSKYVALYPDVESRRHVDELDAARSTLVAQHDALRADRERSIDNPCVPEYIILANARRICAQRFKKIKNWSLAMEIFGLGSTWAWALCERAGVDPDNTNMGRATARHALDQAPETRGCGGKVEG